MKILAIGDFHGKFPKKLKKKLEKEEFDIVIGIGDYSGISDWYPYIMNMLKLSKKGEDFPSIEEFFGKKKYKTLLKKDYNSGKKIISELNKFGKPGFIIFGNTDSDFYKFPFGEDRSKKGKFNKLVDRLKNLKDLNYKKVNYNGFGLVGFGGYMDIEAYFNKKDFKMLEDIEDYNERKDRLKKQEEKLFSLLRKMKSKDLFIFHYPPYGYFDIIKGKKRVNPMVGNSAGVKFFTKVIKKYQPRLALSGHMHEYQGKKSIGKTTFVVPGAAVDGKAAIIDISKDKKKNVEVKFIK